MPYNAIQFDLSDRIAIIILVKSKDHREGIRAFREKRKPEFKGE